MRFPPLSSLVPQPKHLFSVSCFGCRDGRCVVLGSWFGVSLACAGGVGSFLVVMVVILGGDVYCIQLFLFVFLGADGVGRERGSLPPRPAGGIGLECLLGALVAEDFDPGVE